MEQYEEREKRSDYRAGMICRAFAGGKVEDYFPNLTPPAPDADHLLRKIEMLNARFGGKDMRKHGG
jgi:hypothetical protein